MANNTASPQMNTALYTTGHYKPRLGEHLSSRIKIQPNVFNIEFQVDFSDRGDHKSFSKCRQKYLLSEEKNNSLLPPSLIQGK